MNSSVELIDDFKRLFVSLLRGCSPRKQPSYSKMRLGAQPLRDQRIGGLLDAIMDEPVSTSRALDHFLMARRPQNRIQLPLRHPEDQRKCRALGNVAETSHLLQRILRGDRKPGQLPHHEIN